MGVCFFGLQETAAQLERWRKRTRIIQYRDRLVDELGALYNSAMQHSLLLYLVPKSNHGD